eukprot:TRINITY_DN40727_c0_g2_i1.p1 TRINITY_DN40727_c0_g2~~TRINITY_DN40727_c0_g2_i1.p1  ORF type:complete len:1155 (-),score=285.77 TRINITY_DN40727_c0_g2_i1:167-3631(-)
MFTPSTRSPGVGGQNVVPDDGRWDAVYDQLRSRQSLSSVINDPSRGRSVFQNTNNFGDFVERLKESVEEIGGQNVEAEKAAELAVQTKCEQLVGPLPDLAEFRSYLDTINDVWEIYRRNHRSRVSSSKARNGHALPSDATPGGMDAKQTAQTPGGAAEVEAWAAHHSVPSEYFMGDFKLDQHQIFRQPLQVSVEREHELNAELTGHLDLIEVSLFEHIKMAQRDQLFDSLVRLGEPLQEDLQSALSVVSVMRQKLASAQQQKLRFGRRVGKLARRRARVNEVLQRLDCLTHVQQAQPSIEMLLQGQDYLTALELLESTKGALDSNLKGLVSIKAGSTRLSKLGGTFDRAVEAGFVYQSAEAIMEQWYRGDGDETPAAAPFDKNDALRNLCSCLVKRDLLKSALGSTLRDVLLTNVKKALKTKARNMLEEMSGAQQALVDEAEDGDATPADRKPSPSPRGDAAVAAASTASASPRPEEKPNVSPRPQAAAVASMDASAGVAAALAKLSFDAFVAFWQRLMQGSVGLAERFCDYACFIQATARSLKEAPSKNGAPPTDAAEAAGELLRLFEVMVSSLLQKVGVLMQARYGDPKTCRSPKLAEWQRLIKVTNDSLDNIKMLQDRCKQRLAPKEVVAVSDVRGSLRALLYTQTKSVIEELHQERVAQVESALKQEKWDRTDVPSQYRQLVDKLLGMEERAQPEEADAGGEQSSDRFLRVDGVNYLVVPALLTLIQVLTDYLGFCRAFESLGAEIVQRLVKLLRNFNTEMQKLVLGGQAVSKGLLRRITAANLALCSQSCGLMAQLLPSVQTTLLAVLQGSQSQGGGALSRAVAAMAEDLSKVASEFTEHRTALLGKLSDLLRERYDITAKKWLTTPHPDMSAVSLSLSLQGVNLVDVAKDEKLYASFEGAAKEAISAETGGACTSKSVEVTVSGSSLQVYIKPPSGTECSAVHSKLAASASSSLPQTLAAKLRAVPGLSIAGASSISSSTPAIKLRLDPEPWSEASATQTAAGSPRGDVDLCPHEALEGLVKDITAMYKVLLKNLNGDSVRRIFAKAFEEIGAKFEQKLGQEIVASTPPYDGSTGRSLGDRLVMDIAYLHRRDQLGSLSGIAAPLQHLLLELLRHLQTKLPAEDATKAVHPVVIEALQRNGWLPLLPQ